MSKILLKNLEGRGRFEVEDDIKMDLRGVGSHDVDWVYFLKERDHWWALITTITNFWVPLKSDERLSAFQEGLY